VLKQVLAADETFHFGVSARLSVFHSPLEGALAELRAAEGVLGGALRG